MVDVVRVPNVAVFFPLPFHTVYLQPILAANFVVILVLSIYEARNMHMANGG